MTNSLPTVQVIIVTWNKKKDVLSLLSQLKTIDFPADRLSILVVDNASTDGTAMAIETDYPKITLIKHRENRGGAGGFNAGMRWTLANRPDTDYLWLLDNDVRVDPKALNVLVRVMEHHPRAALCGSKIMDINQRDRMIELGAFIDYSSGDVQRNEQGPGRLDDADTVVQVDYVAACSLLARVSMVKTFGLWRESFFIYWDDMEWGARFNAAGCDVLAANGSIVYHPSWVNRTADQSAIWRNYYRTRNSLWFFNHYGSGMRKRLLLGKMVNRYFKFALSSAVNASNGLSRAFINGIEDFFSDDFGKKTFLLKPACLNTAIEENRVSDIMMFVPDMWSWKHARRLADDLGNTYPGLRIRSIIPDQARRHWTNRMAVKDTFFYSRNTRDGISLEDKCKILRFLLSRPWQLLVSPPRAPRLGTVWGRPVARIDYSSHKIFSIDRMIFNDVCRLLFRWPIMLFRALFLSPKSDVKKKH